MRELREVLEDISVILTKSARLLTLNAGALPAEEDSHAKENMVDG
jgi:hypothetical protein